MEIWRALNNNDLPALERLFAAHPDQINAYSGIAGGTLLHYAAGKSSPAVISYLLDIGFDVNLGSSMDGHCAIDTAASDANVEVVELLLARGASVDVKSGERNPLYGAIIAGRGHTEHWIMIRAPHVAELLLRAGLDYNHIYPKKMRTPSAREKSWQWGAREIHELMETWDKAAKAGEEPRLPFTCAVYKAMTAKDLPAIEALFAAEPQRFKTGTGLFEDLQTPFGTWLHCACVNSSPEVIDFFVRNGFDIDQISNEREPLWMAARCDNVEAVEYLLKRGARIGLDVLHNPLFCAINRDSAECVRVLLDAGMNPRRLFDLAEGARDPEVYARAQHKFKAADALAEWRG